MKEVTLNDDRLIGYKGGKMNICTLSGGKASAYCADLSIKKYGKENIILYFNDTKWEHPDLYRFLKELSLYWGIPITEDSDGRSPEQIFEDNHALANNRMPFCSRILKAERLQKYYKNGDNIIFGIGIEEKHRAERLIAAYQKVAVKTNRWATLEFPLIANKVSSIEVSEWLNATGIKVPELYRLGFEHNNCNGGCVRAGKKHWAHLLSVLPEVYKDREQVEESFRKRYGKDVHFFKDETLKHYRERIEAKDQHAFEFTEEDIESARI
jgi:3'-phosphoadenosine 5'-phosphosulfate sulfotransferase (PAPS reductase)/FAD synthetase